MKLRQFLPAVVRQHGSAVVAVDQVVRVVGINEQRMVVAVHASQPLERFATVARHVQRQAHHVDGVLVVRVDANLSEHPAVGGGERTHVAIRLAHLSPRLALVVRAIDFGTANTPAPLATVGVSAAATRPTPLRSCR